MGQGFKEADLIAGTMLKRPSAVATLRCNHQLDGILVKRHHFDEDGKLFYTRFMTRIPLTPPDGDVGSRTREFPVRASCKSKRWKKMIRPTTSLTKIFTVVGIFRPRTASLENVTGMLSKKEQC
jgi:hypothetical protein